MTQQTIERERDTGQIPVQFLSQNTILMLDFMRVEREREYREKRDNTRFNNQGLLRIFLFC